MLKFFYLTGNSMEPTIKSDSIAIVITPASYFVGDIVVIRINQGYYIVKRAVAINNGRISIGSDNQRTSSSFCDYSYRETDIMGKVKFTIKIPGLVNRLGKYMINLIKFFECKVKLLTN